MNTPDTTLSDALARLLQDLCTPDALLAIDTEAGALADDASPARDGPYVTLWNALSASGFLDTLVPEDRDGAGLNTADAFALLLEAGRHAVPAPFAATLLARGWLARHGLPAPDGSIAIAMAPPQPATPAATDAGNTAHISPAVSFGRVADWLLAPTPDGKAALWRCADARRTLHGGHGSLDARLEWPAARTTTPGAGTAGAETPPGISAGHDDGSTVLPLPAPGDELAPLAALAGACLMAGAAERTLSMTLDYAGQRQQFGRSIGRFQAVQQQVSVMAELAAATRMAAQLACRTQAPAAPSPVLAAIAKSRASDMAGQIADIAHAVHGAIGVTQEYALQTLTRRLREWRRNDGTAAYWSERVGNALLDANGVSLLDFLQADAR